MKIRRIFFIASIVYIHSLTLLTLRIFRHQKWLYAREREKKVEAERDSEAIKDYKILRIDEPDVTPIREKLISFEIFNTWYYSRISSRRDGSLINDWSLVRMRIKTTNAYKRELTFGVLKSNKMKYPARVRHPEIKQMKDKKR